MGEFSGREPCPARILDDIGGAFSMGAVGGSIWHSVKGFRNSPKGWSNSFKGSLEAVKARGPVVGGNFAVWGALFASFDCSFAALRHKEDPWNSIMSGAATGAVLAARAGPKAAGKNALMGGVLLAAIEGLGIMITKMTAPPMPTADDFAAQGAQDPLAPPSASLFPSSGSSGGGGGMSDLFGVGAPGSENDPEFSLDSDFSPTDPGNSMLDPAPSEPKKKGW
eukprot:CAMPEP_0182532090 /NCGR_PEP_ID=MMETSP1323-20130603/10832_1 /TAXON_ID=236787 /ORGANISM="Florenciella parvula, Strain RCC1693" /LENGTH=222 /DNA_ID=CAMNT_0024741769 /DNA_START=104 /DNA_END=769 /DNA_ORIENTATION=-